MGKPSTSSKAAVKVNPKQQQEISKIFGLDVQKIIAEGMESFIASGTKVLLESLMKAEVQDLCGDWHGRGESRDRVRWGFEQGTAKVGGGIITITRPRVRLLRGQPISSNPRFLRYEDTWDELQISEAKRTESGG